MKATIIYIFCQAEKIVLASFQVLGAVFTPVNQLPLSTVNNMKAREAVKAAMWRLVREGPGHEKKLELFVLSISLFLQGVSFADDFWR